MKINMQNNMQNIARNMQTICRIWHKICKIICRICKKYVKKYANPLWICRIVTSQYSAYLHVYTLPTLLMNWCCRLELNTTFSSGFCYGMLPLNSSSWLFGHLAAASSGPIMTWSWGVTVELELEFRLGVWYARARWVRKFFIVLCS